MIELVMYTHMYTETAHLCNITSVVPRYGLQYLGQGVWEVLQTYIPRQEGRRTGIYEEMNLSCLHENEWPFVHLKKFWGHKLAICPDICQITGSCYSLRRERGGKDLGLGCTDLDSCYVA